MENNYSHPENSVINLRQLSENSVINLRQLSENSVINLRQLPPRSERDREGDEEESKMENNYSHPENSVINLRQLSENSVINLRQLPPIDPSRIVNPSFNRKWSKPKFWKPNFNRGLKSFKSDEAPRKSNSSPSSSGKTSENHGNTTTSDSDAAENGMKQGSARSNLYEICTANHWKPPVFECCQEEGPSHRRKFTFKVVFEMEAGLKTTVECFSSPHPKKKAAADHAAEGALWFLKHEGHVRKNK